MLMNVELWTIDYNVYLSLLFNAIHYITWFYKSNILVWIILLILILFLLVQESGYENLNSDLKGSTC